LYSFFTKGTIQQWEYGTSKEVAGSNPSVQPCFSMEQTHLTVGDAAEAQHECGNDAAPRNREGGSQTLPCSAKVSRNHSRESLQHVQNHTAVRTFLMEKVTV